MCLIHTYHTPCLNPGGGDDRTLSVEATSQTTDLSQVFADLSPGTEYSYSVVISNAFGDSEPLTISVTTPMCTWWDYDLFPTLCNDNGMYVCIDVLFPSSVPLPLRYLVSVTHSPMYCAHVIYGSMCAGSGGCELDAGEEVCVCEGKYLGLTCSDSCPSVDAQICSGHGTCDSASLTCSCDQDHSGVDCSEDCPCPEHSFCSSEFGSNETGSSLITCVCEEGRVALANGTCALCPGDPPCQGSGTCALDSTETPTCACDLLHAGSECELSCEESLSSCNDHGSCVTSIVDPDSPACACDDGYYGSDCSVTCSAGSAAEGELCSGYGACVLIGESDEPATGTTDSLEVTCECDAQHVSEDCSITCPGLLGAYACSAQGTCVYNGTQAVCECYEGFEGVCIYVSMYLCIYV